MGSGAAIVLALEPGNGRVGEEEEELEDPIFEQIRHTRMCL